MEFFDSFAKKSDLAVGGDMLYVGTDGIGVNRDDARELAAILLHFADTGELPGEVGDAKD